MADAPSEGRQHRKVSTRSVVIAAIVVVAVLVIFLLLGTSSRRAQHRRLAARAQQAVLADSIPRVVVQAVNRAAGDGELMLPGTLQSSQSAEVYARASGYIAAWYADIGTRVHAGQLLARIEAPDLDQQLAQARNEVASAHTTRQLNAVNLARWQVLFRDSTVTKQELDTYQTNFDASVATEAAAENNVRRLEALVGYERVTAPFTGVVTARNVEDGVFVTAAGETSAPQPAGAGGNTIVGSSSVTALFTVARTDTVRVYIGVPQAYAPAVHVGMPAPITAQELPGRSFAGRVARTASSIDAASRTLLTEVDATNTNHILLPGMYTEVHLRFVQPDPPVLLPATALIFRTLVAQTAVVGPDSVVHIHNLEIGRDFGTTMEVDSGLADGDIVVINPPDNLSEGRHVRPRPDLTAQPGPLAQQPSQASSGSGKSPQQGAQGQRPRASTDQAASAGGGYHPPPQMQEGFPGSPGLPPASVPASARDSTPRR